MQAASRIEIGRLKKDAAESLRRGDGDKARGLLDRVRYLLGTRPPSPARDTEPDDLEHLGRHVTRGDAGELCPRPCPCGPEHLGRHVTRGDAGSPQKAARCQQELRSRGRSDYLSGRETRRWQ